METKLPGFHTVEYGEGNVKIRLSRFVPEDGPITKEDVIDFALSKKTAWMTRDGLAQNTQFRAPNLPVGVNTIYGFGGVMNSEEKDAFSVGDTEIKTLQHQVSIHLGFTYPSRLMSVIDALHEIEEYMIWGTKGGELPTELATALLAAELGLRKSGTSMVMNAPAVLAFADHTYEKDYDPSTANDELMSPEEIERRVRLILNNLFSQQSTDVILPVVSVDRARFWLALSEIVWDHDIRKNIPRIKDPNWRDLLESVATAGLELRRRHLSIPIGERILKMPEGTLGAYYLDGMYNQAVEISAMNMPPECVANFFSGGHLRYDRNLLNNTKGAEHLSDLPVDKTMSFAQAILEEAEAQAIFDLSGSASKIRLPKDTIISKTYGIQRVKIWVQSTDRVWVTVQSQMHDGETFLWQPFDPHPISNRLMPEWTAAYMHLHLAGLWHDLRTAGEKALIPQKSHGRTPKSMRKPRPIKTENPERILPRQRRVLQHLALGGTYQWGSDEERSGIVKSRHWVDGFCRYLPSEWKASEKQKALAREAGIILLPGETFVRGHFRGKEGEIGDLSDDENAPPMKRYYAKGLARLLTLPGVIWDE